MHFIHFTSNFQECVIFCRPVGRVINYEDFFLVPDVTWTGHPLFIEYRTGQPSLHDNAGLEQKLHSLKGRNNHKCRAAVHAVRR